MMDSSSDIVSPLMLNGSATAEGSMQGVTGKSKEEERFGLSSGEVEDLLVKYGYNELPSIELPLWYIFCIQFTGTMPYMLWIACILSLAVEDWVDFAIIFAMLLCNGK